ncbi:MAG: hypothetical protein WC635_07580 [Bacteriovorax sp.]|jgi:hypothetical protein
MKVWAILFSLFLTINAIAAVPTEEGLLKNLNNAGIPGNLITIKAMINSVTVPAETGTETEMTKMDFYKFVISLENPNVISLLQVAYSNGQMLSSQIKDVKYIPDLVTAIKREVNPDRSLFYGILMMLTTNKSQGVEAFLEKSGVQIVRNKNILNEEKMKLLKAYRSYLATSKGKGDAASPLNPTDAQNKAKVLELFRANTFQRARNIELIKLENEFLWKVDWKNIKAYFTNEERRFRLIDYVNGDISVKIEANDYLLFNGTNELPKNMTVKDTKGLSNTIQIISLDTKGNREKKLSERFEEAKKSIPAGIIEANYSFLF